MSPYDARLALVAVEARVRTSHVHHLLAALAEGNFSAEAFCAFTGLEAKHVEAMLAALAAGGLMPAPKRRSRLSAREGAQQRATRLPDVLQLPAEWLTFAQTERRWDATTVEKEFQLFLDHWHGIGGQRGLKSDWLATWRNWCRRSYREDGTYRPGSASDTTLTETETAEAKWISDEWRRLRDDPRHDQAASDEWYRRRDRHYAGLAERRRV